MPGGLQFATLDNMRYQFTPAAERALFAASAWSNRAKCDELEAEPLLVGLLSEPECRAAAMLARRAIDLHAICQRWPGLRQEISLPGGGTRIKSLSRQVEISLELSRQRLAAFPRPFEMATEHILLGLAAADHEVGVWLREQGIDPDTLAADIHTLYGYREECPSKADECQSTFVELANPKSHEVAALRILDAAGNRAREGLRVIEDLVRFMLDDRHLTNLCKQLRHDLTETIAQVPMANRLAARETQADVGTVLTTVSEQRRTDTAAVLAANFARLQESLRSLEEFAKLIDAGLAEQFKQLRYRTYTLQRAIDITQQSVERLATAHLYVLIDGRESAEAFERLARGLIEAGVDVLQLRDKRLDDRQLLERGRLLRTLTQGSKTLFVMNDRPDLAALAQADGVHVGQEELSVKDTRSIVGPEMLVGVSTHSLEQAQQAVLDGANYIGVGPTFPSETKAFERFPGVELLRTVAAEIRLPAFAIGGICRENLGQVLATGFTRIAVSGAVTAADDPAQAARELLAQLLIPTTTSPCSTISMRS